MYNLNFENFSSALNFGKGTPVGTLLRWYWVEINSHIGLLLLLLLLLPSHFSRVRLSATQQTAAHQAPPSLGFSRQERWSGLPFPSPVHACMLSHLSHVQFCVILWTAAHQAPPSTGFSRQEYWSRLPFKQIKPKEKVKFCHYCGIWHCFLINFSIIICKENIPE